MNFSFPIAIFVIFAAYCEVQERRTEASKASGEVYFLKNMEFKVRAIVYAMDLAFLVYNYVTQFDSIPMAMIVCLTLNLVLNLTRLRVDKNGVKIGNTFMRKDLFREYSFTSIDDKQSKFEFTFLVRQRPFTKSMFLKTELVEPLNAAIKKMKNGKA